MNFVVLLQKLGISFTKVLPLKITDKIAAGFGLLFCYLSKKKRGYIEKNLQYIFSDRNITPEQFNFYVKRTFINFARAMVDFFRLGFISKEGFNVKQIGFENVDKALKLKRGGILISLHLGNWDYGGSYLAVRGVPMSALVEVTESEMLDLYTKHRERLGMKTFSVTRAGYAFLNALKSNCLLAVLADRDIIGNGITMNFFSGKRKIPKGLAEIIIKRKMPVLFSYMVLNPFNKTHRYFSVIEPPMLFNGSVDEFNRLMMKKFEGYIRQYPDQWFVFHPEWIEEGANT